jgi:hypothetical protein
VKEEGAGFLLAGLGEDLQSFQIIDIHENAHI